MDGRHQADDHPGGVDPGGCWRRRHRHQVALHFASTVLQWQLYPVSCILYPVSCVLCLQHSQNSLHGHCHLPAWLMYHRSEPILEFPGGSNFMTSSVMRMEPKDGGCQVSAQALMGPLASSCAEQHGHGLS